MELLQYHEEVGPCRYHCSAVVSWWKESVWKSMANRTWSLTDTCRARHFQSRLLVPVPIVSHNSQHSPLFSIHDSLVIKTYIEHQPTQVVTMVYISNDGKVAERKKIWRWSLLKDICYGIYDFFAMFLASVIHPPTTVTQRVRHNSCIPLVLLVNSY
jgi:Selenoprotein SelK_SelG